MKHYRTGLTDLFCLWISWQGIENKKETGFNVA